MLARITVRTNEVLDHASNHSNAGLPAELADSIIGLLSQTDDAARAFADKLKAAAECAIVYHGCGSCADGGALVEYFCGSGGSTPDYVRCEPC